MVGIIRFLGFLGFLVVLLFTQACSFNEEEEYYDFCFAIDDGTAVLHTNNEERIGKVFWDVVVEEYDTTFTEAEFSFRKMSGDPEGFYGITFGMPEGSVTNNLYYVVFRVDGSYRIAKRIAGVDQAEIFIDWTKSEHLYSGYMVENSVRIVRYATTSDYLIYFNNRLGASFRDAQFPSAAIGILGAVLDEENFPSEAVHVVYKFPEGQ